MATVLATLLLFTHTGTTLEVVAILVYGNKEVKPVAHTYFTVLDKDIETILHEAEVGCELPVVLPSDQMNGCPDVLDTFSRIDKWRDRNKASRVSSLVTKHVITSAYTDLSGKMTLTGLPVNTNLWLFGAYQLPMSTRQQIWNVALEPFTLPTPRKVLLNNDNLYKPKQGLRNLTFMQR